MANKCVVYSSNNRCFWFDENLSIGTVRQEMENRGFNMSFVRTMREYGLKYTDRRTFIGNYHQEFNLGEFRGVDEIRLKELRMYKESILGFAVRGGCYHL